MITIEGGVYLVEKTKRTTKDSQNYQSKSGVQPKVRVILNVWDKEKKCPCME